MSLESQYRQRPDNYLRRKAAVLHQKRRLNPNEQQELDVITRILNERLERQQGNTRDDLHTVVSLGRERESGLRQILAGAQTSLDERTEAWVPREEELSFKEVKTLYDAAFEKFVAKAKAQGSLTPKETEVLELSSHFAKRAKWLWCENEGSEVPLFCSPVVPLSEFKKTGIKNLTVLSNDGGNTFSLFTTAPTSEIWAGICRGAQLTYGLSRYNSVLRGSLKESDSIEHLLDSIGAMQMMLDVHSNGKIVDCAKNLLRQHNIRNREDFVELIVSQPSRWLEIKHVLDLLVFNEPPRSAAEAAYRSDVLQSVLQNHFDDDSDVMLGDTQRDAFRKAVDALSETEYESVPRIAPYSQQVEFLNVISPGLLKSQEVLQTVAFANVRGRTYMLYQDSQDARAARVIAYAARFASPADDAYMEPLLRELYPEAPNRGFVPVPSVQEMEQAFLTGQTYEGNFEEGSDEPEGGGSEGGGGGGSSGPARATQRVRILRNVLLRNQRNATFVWDRGGMSTKADGRANFTTTTAGHYVVITVEDEALGNRQFVIRDDPPSSWVLPTVLATETLAENINPEFLRRHGGRPLFWNSREQFEHVAQQAIDMNPAHMRSAHFGSIEALVLHQGHRIRQQLDDLLAHVNEERAEEDKPPISLEELTASRIARMVESGRARGIPVCGGTFLRHLARDAGVERSSSYVVQKDTFDAVKRLLLGETDTPSSEGV